VRADRAGWRRVDWAYDALGRRIRQTSYVLSNGVWVVTEDLKFVSDPVLVRPAPCRAERYEPRAGAQLRVGPGPERDAG
jgi:hypothetical protein